MSNIGLEDRMLELLLFEMGERHCEKGIPQQCNDKEYLDGYRRQYAKEQQLTAQGESNGPR